MRPIKSKKARVIKCPASPALNYRMASIYLSDCAMLSSPLLEQLIEALRYLPGVGPKTAQRMAFQLLERGREKGKRLAKTLQDAMQDIQHCKYCRTVRETDDCKICASPQRDTSLLCIVESPADIVAVEQMGSYRGRYFV